MPNTISRVTLIDGPVNLVQLINILGDGSGEESDTILVDRSTFAPTNEIELIVEKIEGLCNAFTATLEFDGTTDLPFVRLPADNWFCHDWHAIGGVSSNKVGAGATGDILLTTASLGIGDAATFYLHMRKK